MFYLSELCYRFFYINSCFFVTFTIFFSYKDCMFTFLFNFIPWEVEVSAHSLIYTHPLELLSIQLSFVLLFVFLFLTPYIIWQVFDFFCIGFYKKEYQKIKNIGGIICISYFSFISIAMFYLFPKFWKFLFSFVQTTLNISFELKVWDYCYFLWFFFYSLNTVVCFLAFLCLAAIFVNIKTFLKIKKFCIFLSIVIATFISPPDVLSQLVILLLLLLFLEFIFFFNSLVFKFLKFKKVEN